MTPHRDRKVSAPRTYIHSALGIALFLALLGVPPHTTQAAPLCVNTTGAGGCFTSIQAAVTAAASGDIITVAAGLYTEAVTIPSGKTLTLRGAQSGVDARTRSIPPNVATESIVTTNPTNSVIFSVQANDVEIDGFTMQGPTSGAAVNSAPTITNIRVLNNITYNLPTGFQIRALGPAQTIVRRNWSDRGSAGTMAAFFTNNLTNALVEENLVTTP